MATNVLIFELSNLKIIEALYNEDCKWNLSRWRVNKFLLIRWKMNDMDIKENVLLCYNWLCKLPNYEVSIFVCLFVNDIFSSTYLEVLFPTNVSTILSFPLPSWGGRKLDFTRKLASLEIRLHNVTLEQFHLYIIYNILEWKFMKISKYDSKYHYNDQKLHFKVQRLL